MSGDIGQAAWEAWQLAPEPATMSNVLKELDPVLVSEVQRYNGPKDILHMQAKQLAIKGIKSYDPVQGTSLRTWVTTQLKPLSRYGQHLRTVRLPEAVLRQAAELNTVREKLHDEYGRLPTDGELADEMGISSTRVAQLQDRARASVSESQMVTPEGAQVSPAVTKPKTMDFVLEAVYQDLSPKEQLILDWKTGLHDKELLSNQEIAQRLQVSPAYVTQLSQRISQRIQEVNSRAV